MATLAFELGEEFYVVRDSFKKTDDYPSVFACDTSIDLADAISKQHLPNKLYLETLLKALQSNAQESTVEDGQNGYTACAELVEVLLAEITTN